MSKFIKLKVHGLKELDKALNALDLDLREKAMRKAGREALKPVEARAKKLAPKDTYNLEKSIKTSASTRSARRAGRRAALQARVSAGGRTSGIPGSYILSQEYGSSKQKGTPFLRPAIKGHERTVIMHFRKQLKRSIDMFAKKQLRRNKRK